MGVVLAFVAGMAGGRLGAAAAPRRAGVPRTGVDERVLRSQMAELLIMVRDAPAYEMAMVAVQLELMAARLHMLKSMN